MKGLLDESSNDRVPVHQNPAPGSPSVRLGSGMEKGVSPHAQNTVSLRK